MKETTLITKDNRLIEASYRLSLVESRIMQMAIAWTRAHDTELTPDTWVELHSTEYSALYDLDIKAAYRQLKAAARELRDRRLSVEGIHPETGDVVTIEGGWVSYVMYSTKNGTIALQFSKLIIPYISALESRFTSYQIKHVASFSSVYAIRLYELCKQYLKIGKRSFSISELREYLEATEASYDRIDNFKNKVLDRAVQQINEASDILIKYETLRMGRSVTGYTFLITSMEQDIPFSKPAQQPTTPPATGLSIAEQSMLKQLAAQTGLAEAYLLVQAKKFDRDLFIALDYMLKQTL